MSLIKEEVWVGMGQFFKAPLGTLIPDDFDDHLALPAPWVEMGYTQEGLTKEYALTTTDIEADQSFDPIRVVTTARRITLATRLIQLSAENLKAAFGGGTITPVDPDAIPGNGDEYDEYTPPDVGEEEEIALIFDALDAGRKIRVIVQNAKREGTSTITFRKGEAAGINVTWVAQKPTFVAATPITEHSVVTRLLDV